MDRTQDWEAEAKELGVKLEKADKKIEKLREKKFPHSYHVAYSFQAEDGKSGNGQMTVDRTYRIRSSDDVKSVREFIEKENGFTSVVIINFIKLHKSLWK